MTRRFRTMNLSTASGVNVTSSVNVSGGEAVVSVNGRVFRVDVSDAVSVKVVSDDSGTYIELTDKYGRTRRVACAE